MPAPTFPVPDPAAAHIRAQASVSVAEVREIVYEGRAIPRHSHATAGFCFVAAGEYEERYSQRSLACAARTVTFSPAGEEHANVFRSRAHCLTVDIAPSFIDRLDSSGAGLGHPFERRGGTLAWLGERLMMELHRPDTSSLIMEGLVLEMTGEALRALPPERSISTAVRRAYELVNDRYTEPLSIADIATALGRHPIYLASAFRRAYGETIGDRIRQLRIEHASRLLAGSDMPLNDVGAATGFASQSHFTRVFKAATGSTPGGYRRRIRG